MEAEVVKTIICPNCNAEVDASASVCDHCGAATTPRREARELMNRPWVIVILMLHVGFLGIPVYWKTNYSVATRLLMIVASILYTVGAVAAIIWLVQYIAARILG